MGKLVKLNPFIQETVWGGDNLARLKNLNHSGKIGETWEVSTLSEGSSMIGDIPLKSLCSLSYLVKFIDTSANLSIQVHPGDEYAKLHENSSGKTECWIILDAKEGAGIYLGFKKGVTKKEFFNAVKNGIQVDQFLNFIPVKRGDFFFLPPGTIHSIGKDITLCEVQQNSGITYRVWDWNRVGLDGKPRELHIDKASDVINFNDDFNQSVLDKKQSDLFYNEEIKTIVRHEDFQVQFFNLPKDKEMTLNLKEKDSLVVLSGLLEGFNCYDAAIALEAGNVEVKTMESTSFIIISHGK